LCDYPEIQRGAWVGPEQPDQHVEWSSRIGVDARLWGKSDPELLSNPYPLICHMLDTAAMAGALVDGVLGDVRSRWLAAKIGVVDAVLRGLVMFWAGLHDIGKISPPFQSKVDSLYSPLADDPDYACSPLTDEQRRFHHSHASQWILGDLFAQSGYPAPGGPFADVAPSSAHKIAQMLGGHHGRFHSKTDLDGFHCPRDIRPSELGRGAWAEQAKAHFAALRWLIGPDAEVVPSAKIPTAALAVVTGLVVCADWLASQEHYIGSPGRLTPKDWEATADALIRHWQQAISDAPQIVREAGLGAAHFRTVHQGVAGFRERFPRIQNPNPLQQSLAERLADVARGPGLLLITAPPGDGKTEASEFAAAHLARVSGAGGLAFALPTMATADAMFRRIDSFVHDNVVDGGSLALVHGMAWLSSDFAALPHDVADGSAILTDGEDGTGVSFATQWLRGRRRGMHASFGAMTIDQALAGVLPLKHNMLRLYGLSGKVIVIDEAHSYGPYMHALLLRLLQWFGAMRVPLVVMSATLAGRTVRSVIDAYRRGCGYSPLGERMPTVPYPGWLFVDAQSGDCTDPVSVGTARAHGLSIAMHGVRRSDDPAEAALANERLQVVKNLLAPIRKEGGCILVCCNTVDEAQETYAHLKSVYADAAEILLLHARFRAVDRLRITRRCEAAFGKPGGEGVRRPRAAILVGTQIVEQSVDLDFDLVISDLAPLALLIQRTGRCRRHQRDGRPAWTSGESGQAQLVVLEPVGEAGQYVQPKRWGSVYFEALLRKTSGVLRGLDTRIISIPEDVQGLIEAVYGELFAAGGAAASEAEKERAAMQAAELVQYGTEIAERQIADFVAIPPPGKVRDLAELSGANAAGLMNERAEALVATRLGADSVRLVLVYQQPDGVGSLDPQGNHPLPEAQSGQELRIEQVRLLMEHAVPAPGWWLRSGEAHHPRETDWQRQPVLRDLVPIFGAGNPDGSWRASAISLLDLQYEPDGRGLRRCV
jgi:CRISPR-associated endonuclease/helicase Cas3